MVMYETNKKGMKKTLWDDLWTSSDAKHSVFKDNVNRVKQANADVLKELDIN